MKKHIYTEDEKAEITRLYPHHPTKEVARFLGMPVTSVYNIANRLGLKKSPEYLKVLRNEMSRQLADSGTAHRFPKGHVPANKVINRPAGGAAPGAAPPPKKVYATMMSRNTSIAVLGEICGNRVLNTEVPATRADAT